MKVKTRSTGLVIAIGLGVALLACAASVPVGGVRAVAGRSPVAAQPAALGDAVMEWNQQAATRTLTKPAPALAPVEQTRVMAIAQVAVHDAVNGITGEYATYLSPGPAPAGASPEAAAIAAAHHALKNLPVNQSPSLDDAFAASLAARGLSEFDPGVEYGRSAASAILAARAGDGSAQAQFPYSAPGAGSPGVWVPISSAPGAQALLPGWGSVTPFVLRSGSQFRPEAPPALDSEQYAKDYNEIKTIGAAGSPVRTALQTDIATFWLASPTAIWNPVLRQAVAAQNLDLSAEARAVALFYLAASDAGVACWDAKYEHNFWRPQLAIRGGDTDDNDLTTGDGTWTPLHGTPRHPEYPSGHTTNSSAMATILGLLFGEGTGAPIVVTLGSITRQWDTFDEAAAEVIDARVYSGIHFRTADEVGARLGRQVAQFTWTHALRPTPRGRSERP
ncbi:MAG TPA: vanadium-dependent haloperoxidase [Pyrinomonadaceae bacterium]